MLLDDLLHIDKIETNTVKEMIRKLSKFNLKGDGNIIIFGKNSSGKTYLLEKILENGGVLQQATKNVTIQYIPLTRIYHSELLKKQQSKYENISLDTSIDENKRRSQKSWIYDGTVDKAVMYTREKYPEFLEEAMRYIFNINTKIETEIFKEDINKSKISDGYKSVLSIISLIVYGTAYKTPKIEGRKIFTGPSVILLDEIDAYVHQSIESEISNRIIEIFPDCSFILTTHSPLVIRNTRKSTLYKLENKELKKFESYFNQKTDTIYNDIFSVSLGNETVDKYNLILENLIKYKEKAYLINDLEKYQDEIKKMKEKEVEEVTSNKILFNTLLKVIKYYL